MRDQFVGDIGDYAKYALLRALKGNDKCLGVAWYYNNENGNAGDGRHTDYLHAPETWKPLDYKLFTELKKLVCCGIRSLQAVECSGILGTKTKFVKDRVKKGASDRQHWFEKVKSLLAECDLVFADPDNGLYPRKDLHPNSKFKPNLKDSPKRISLCEARALSRCDRTTIIYHHNTRAKGGHFEEIRYWMSKLPDCEYAFYFRPWNPRTFFVVNSDDRIRHRLCKFSERWKEHSCLLYKESEESQVCCISHSSKKPKECILS